MEYKGCKINIRVAGMEGYEAAIMNADGKLIKKVYSRTGEDDALAVAREYIDANVA